MGRKIRARHAGRLRHPAHEGFRNACRVLGPLLIIGGVVMIVVGIYSFNSRFDSDFHRPFPDIPGVTKPAEEKPDLFWLSFVGMLSLIFGIWLTRFGYLGAAARYVAAETAPVATDTINYVARGAREGVREIAAAVAEGVRGDAASRTVLRCHKCDAENDGDAKFCKDCGAALRKSVRCAACNELNDPDAKFCDNCGGKIG